MSDDSLYVYYCTFPSVRELNRSCQLQLKYTQRISHQQQVLLIFERTQKPLALIACFTIRYQCYFIMCGDNETLSEMHISLSLTDKSMNYCQSTVVTSYLCCCLIVRVNVKIMLIQSEETLVKFYCFKLQHPEFPAANKIITLRHFFYPLRENAEFPWKGTLANAIFPCSEILATIVMDYYLLHYK